MREVDGQLRDREGLLPRSGAIAYEGCSLSDLTLVIDPGAVDQCPYKEIQRVLFQGIQAEGREMVMNDEYRMLFVFKDGEEDQLPNNFPASRMIPEGLPQYQWWMRR